MAEWKKYPQTLHKWPQLTVTVRDDDALAARVDEGWSERPVMEEPGEPVEAPADAPKKRGRPRKDETVN